MDEIIKEGRTNRSVWTVAAVAVALFTLVVVLAGSLGGSEVTTILNK